MAYYKHENYFSEKEMAGWSEERKAVQRELNWDIRLEHYAVSNRLQFRKMVEKWAESFDFPSPGVPTMKMLHILKLARLNGILSDTICEFARAEEDLLAMRPGFISPAAVPFNTEKKTKTVSLRLRLVLKSARRKLLRCCRVLLEGLLLLSAVRPTKLHGNWR